MGKPKITGQNLQVNPKTSKTRISLFNWKFRIIPFGGRFLLALETTTHEDLWQLTTDLEGFDAKLMPYLLAEKRLCPARWHSLVYMAKKRG